MNMNVCTCVYIYICTYVYMHMYTSIYTSISTHIRTAVMKQLLCHTATHHILGSYQRGRNKEKHQRNIRNPHISGILFRCLANMYKYIYMYIHKYVLTYLCIHELKTYLFIITHVYVHMHLTRITPEAPVSREYFFRCIMYKHMYLFK